MRLILLLALILLSPAIVSGQPASVTTLEAGAILDIKSVRFAHNSSTLHDSTAGPLQKVMSVLRSMKGSNLKIQGLAMFVEREPEALALRRAESVKEALVKLGANPGRLETEVYVDSSYAIPTLSLSELAERRRVEFIVLEKKK